MRISPQYWPLIAVVAIGAPPGVRTDANAQSTKTVRGASARSTAALQSVARARSLLTSGDSAGAAEQLREATEQDRSNGPLWHEYGMLLSAMNKGARRNGDMVWPAGMADRAVAAENALAMAQEFAPDSVQFAFDYAQYLWSSRYTNADKVIDLFRGTVNRMATHVDSARTGEAADFLAHLLWRRFEHNIGMTESRHSEDFPDFLADNGAHKAPTPFMPREAGSAPDPMGAPAMLQTNASPGNEPPLFRTTEDMLDFVKREYPQPKIMLGAAMFPEIVRFARLARTLMPDSESYFRHEAQVYAGMKQWDELGALARARIAERPAQPWPWLALGLSEYNRRSTPTAMFAFDSGFARLSNDDRERLTSIQRLMKAPQAAIYDTLSQLGRRQFRQFYFNSANPSMLLGTNPIIAEFRARAVYAELQFSEETNHERGADTDAGDTWIRYGPPDVAVMRRLPITIAGPPLNIWFYLPPHFSVTFYTGTVSGSKHFTPHTRDILGLFAPEYPSLWANLPIVKKGIDVLSTQVARFRATGDSMDIAAFSGINVGILRRGAPSATSTIRHGLFVLDALGADIRHAVASTPSAERNTDALLAVSYRVRAPSSARGVRLEALEPDVEQAAHGLAEFTPMRTRGFGMSELLVASNVELPANSGGARWSNYNIAPIAGSLVRRGSAVSLLWESYEPEAQNGTVHLRFAVTVQRQTDRGFVATAARVIGGLRNAVAERNTGNNQFTITFDRESAATPVQADHLRLDLSTQAVGRYRVQVEVTDLNSGAHATTSQLFEIVK